MLNEHIVIDIDSNGPQCLVGCRSFIDVIASEVIPLHLKNVIYNRRLCDFMMILASRVMLGSFIMHYVQSQTGPSQERASTLTSTY